MRILPGKKGFGQPISQASKVFRVRQRSGSPVRGDIFVVAPSPLIFQLRRSDIGSRLRPKTSRGSNLLLVDSTENSEEPTRLGFVSPICLFADHSKAGGMRNFFLFRWRGRHRTGLGSEFLKNLGFCFSRSKNVGCTMRGTGRQSAPGSGQERKLFLKAMPHFPPGVRPIKAAGDLFNSPARGLSNGEGAGANPVLGAMNAAFG